MVFREKEDFFGKAIDDLCKFCKIDLMEEKI